MEFPIPIVASLWDWQTKEIHRAILFLLLSGWAGRLTADIVSRRPLPLRPPATAGTLFERILPAQSGIDLVHHFPATAPLSLMQEQGAGCGICVGDYDLDGLPDIGFANYDRGFRLYRNLGKGRFADETISSGVRTGTNWCGGVTFVDINNDGNLDLYVCCFNSPNQLYLNLGGGRFREAAHQFGLDWNGASVMSAFADYDRDGRLDCYLLTHRDGASEEQRLPRNTSNAIERRVIQRGRSGKPEVASAFQELFQLVDKGQGRMELVVAGQPDQLFRQAATGTFTNSTLAAGIRGNDVGLGVSWWDFDDDGWPDIYVANDHKTPDRLWRNQHDGTFQEVTASALPHMPLASMGTDTGDVNNDGRVDLLATDMAGSTRERRMVIHEDPEKNRWFQLLSRPGQYSRNALYLATGTGRLIEAATIAGLDATDWTWSPKFGDFDNDGWTDLFVANGMSRDYVNADLLDRMKQRGHPGWRSLPPLREINLAFRNLGNLRFERTENEWGLAQLSASFGAAIGDFDRDGNLDLVVMNFEEPVSLYRNTESRNHRVCIRLKGRKDNSYGVGVTVKARTSQGTITRCIGGSSGYMSSNEPFIHIGLGKDSYIGELEVVWPGGPSETYTNLLSNFEYILAQPDLLTNSIPVALHAPAIFRSVEIPGFESHLNAFDDFLREPLLPWKLSDVGPSLAVSDIDGDGDDDFFLGGCAGFAGVIGLQVEPGKFRRMAIPAADQDTTNTDGGAVFFDADGDGDADLFVVSGGVGKLPGAEVYQDRLYLNDGKGNFVASARGSIPAETDSGGPVAVADFDRDGDLDIYMGGRCVPGKYLSIPTSHLWRNDGGRFTEVTDSLAAGLSKSGLVTSAVWADVDGDGWPDLWVANEWGPIRLFHNQNGQLNEVTNSALSNSIGLWQSLAVTDIDGDGDLDLIAGNLGLNSRYNTPPENRFVMVCGDPFDNGSPQLLETIENRGELFPIQGRSTYLRVFPSLIDRLPTHQGFASASLGVIFGTEELRRFERHSLNQLASGVWRNDGPAQFSWVPLPELAQVAPVAGIIANDFDGDGIPDLLLLQNSKSARPETGGLDGGIGIYLRGLGNGHFLAVDPVESGFHVAGHGRSMALIGGQNSAVPMILAASDSGPLKGFSASTNYIRLSSVSLKGSAGNPTAIGARVTWREGTRRTMHVITAGSGYLSQSTARVYFLTRGTPGDHSIEVVWPNGTAVEYPNPKADHGLISLTQPTDQK